MPEYERLWIEANLEVEAFVSYFENTYPPEYSFDGEMHPFWELVYVAEGRIGVTAGERVLEVGAHQVIFHKPMEFHRLWSEGGTSPKLIVTAFEAEGADMKLLEHGFFMCRRSSGCYWKQRRGKREKYMTATIGARDKWTPRRCR